MIHEIKGCKALIPYLKESIEDEGIKIGIDEKLGAEQLAIIKVDEYYSGLHLGYPPKSIDFVVVVDCECDSYVLYLLELKNVDKPKRLIIKDIHEKFEVTIRDFLSERFEMIFLADRYKYKDIKLYLISDAYGLTGKYGTYAEYKKIQEKMQRIQNRDSLRIDVSLGSKLFKFKGKVLKIDYDIPPNPIIRRIS